MAIQIDRLSQHPRLVAVLAHWHQQQWQGQGRGSTVQQRIAKLHEHIKDGNLPVSWVALSNDCDSEGENLSNRLAGSVSLVRYSPADTRTESAWLANLYVIPPLRGGGVGRMLVQHVVDYAAQTKLANLYLFTIDQKNYYQTLGWRWIRKNRVQGQWVDIMQFPLPYTEADHNLVRCNTTLNSVDTANATLNRRQRNCT